MSPSAISQLPAIEEHALVRSISQREFNFFVREFWDDVPQAAPLRWNWHMNTLCDEMQEVAELVFANKPRKHDLIINISPGTSKSTIASIMFPAWVWTRMPKARLLCASHAHDLALDLSRKCRALILSEHYQEVFGSVRCSDDQNAKGHFVLKSGGERMTCTVGGKSPIGRHAHFHLVDDPIDPEAATAESGKELAAANKFMNGTLPSRMVDKDVTPLILIMQRLHQDDPSGNRLGQNSKAGAVRHICLPAELTHHVNPPELAEKYVDGLMDPGRLSRKTLERYHSKGEFYYAGQFLQSPVPLGGGMFKVDRIQIEEAVPNDIKTMTRFWDKAATHDGGAYTVGVKMGVRYDQGLPQFWILDVVRGQWDSAVRERIIRQTAQVDGRLVRIAIEQEPGSGGKESAENTIRNLAGFNVKGDKVTGSKEDRADPFSYQVNSGNVRMKRAPWNEDFLQEMRFFPFSTYKDQVDASSGAFAMLVKARTRVGAL